MVVVDAFTPYVPNYVLEWVNYCWVSLSSHIQYVERISTYNIMAVVMNVLLLFSRKVSQANVSPYLQIQKHIQVITGWLLLGSNHGPWL